MPPPDQAPSLPAPPEPGVAADADAIASGWLRVGVALAVAGQAMVLSLAINLTPAEGSAYWIVHGGLLASALAVLVLLGRDLTAGAWASLRSRRITIDLLFLVTLLGALGGSLTNSLAGTGSVYYEVVAVLVVVHTLGRMAAARSRSAALRASDGLAARHEFCTVRHVDGRMETVPASSLLGGERVVVAPGSAINTDGVIANGRSYVEEAALTGEWRPEPRGPGDRVWAGTHAIDGGLEVIAQGGPRRLDSVLGAVAEARLAPSRLQAQADRLVSWFLPVVLSVATIAGIGWYLSGAAWERALFNAMSVLLVACPCAMGLATPVAVWGGLARLARLGIVARSGDFIDSLARVEVVCFDKTGTLSTDRLAVTAWHFEPWALPRSAELRAAVAALERGIAHPAARALSDDFTGQPSPRPTDIQLAPGQGICGHVASLGELRVGEAAYCGVPAAPPSQGEKRVWVALNGQPAAWIQLAETWRDGVDAAVSELRALGIQVEILTGDRQPPPAPWDGTVTRFAGMDPAAKASRVATLVAEGRTVLFAGDGINDAAALSAASCGLALRSGSDLARAAAMAVCAGEDLRRLPAAVRAARTVRAGIRANLRFAAAYNLAGMALAAAGMLHPVVAALLMVGSSVWVGARALRDTAAAPDPPTAQQLSPASPQNTR